MAISLTSTEGERGRRPEPSLAGSKQGSTSLQSLSGDAISSVSATSSTSPSSNTPLSPCTAPSGKSLPEENEDSAEEPKERRKRSRVSPEQLTVLEATFAADRSPNAARRKEIAGQLGMSERQTQIWFQNRRAKAKQADGGKSPIKLKQLEGGRISTKVKLGDGRRLSIHSNQPPPSPSSPVVSPLTPRTPLYPCQDLDLQRKIHEDESVIVIPCTDLSIGNWTRVASSHDGKQHDLLAYICEAQRRITWYVHYHGNDVEHSVKMDIPLDSITDIELSQGADDTAHASLYLSQPPLFSMEVTAPDGKRVWIVCGDWTEGSQATTILRHDLSGSSAPLTYLWNRLLADIRVPPTPPYFPHSASLPIPSPPMHEFNKLTLQHASPPVFLNTAPRPLQPAYDGFGSYPPHAYRNASMSLPLLNTSLSPPEQSQQLSPLSPLAIAQSPAYSSEYSPSVDDSPSLAFAFLPPGIPEAASHSPQGKILLPCSLPTSLSRLPFAEPQQQQQFLGEPPSPASPSHYGSAENAVPAGLVAPVPDDILYDGAATF